MKNDRFAKIVERVSGELTANTLPSVVRMANDLAGVFLQKSENLNELGDRNEELLREEYRLEESLNKALRHFHGDSFREATTAIIQVLKSGKVDTGQLGSRFVDNLEEGTGKSIYPPKWSVSTQKWDVVRHR